MSGNGQPLIILLVDDNALVRRATARLVRLGGVRVIEADNGIEAISILKTEAHIDVIVTDIQMPWLDGIDLLAEVRRTWPWMPVIAVTGVPLEAIAFDAVLEKPVDAVMLVATINRLRAR